jgi:hypothetical protein
LGEASLLEEDGGTVTSLGGWSPAAGGFSGPTIERYSSGEDRFRGSYEAGTRNGHGTEFLPDGAEFEGEWVDGKFEGRANMYRYPGGETTLLGVWEAGKMIAAAVHQPTGNSGGSSSSADAAIFSFDESTVDRISSDPLLEDPHQAKCVTVNKSKIPGAGLGLFAKVDLPRGQAVAYYTGVRLPADEANDRHWEENGYVISLDSGELDEGEVAVAMDVPSSHVHPAVYKATLGRP